MKKYPRVRLPFEKREIDFGTWVFIHRRGVCGVVILFLSFGILFVGWKIELGSSAAHRAVYVALEVEDAVERPKELKPLDYGDIRNLGSNENASARERLRAAQGGDLAAQEEGLGEQLDANRAKYEEGLRRERELIERSRERVDEKNGENRSVNHGGNVTASYSFSAPVRHDLRLDIPAYRCVGGGRVVVAAALDHNGKVVSAEVAAGSTSDECLRREALASARASSFNLDVSAPHRHRGTITYIFVPQ